MSYNNTQMQLAAHLQESSSIKMNKFVIKLLSAVENDFL